MDDEGPLPTLHPVSSARLWPLQFTQNFVGYLPVLSLTFVMVAAGVALKVGGIIGFLPYFLSYKESYEIALSVCVWISVPAILWLLLKAHPFTEPFADTWYIVTSALMALVLLVTLLLFPQSGNHWLWLTRLFILAALPMQVVQYGLLVRRGMPHKYATPINILGLSMLIYGFVVVH